MSSQWGQSHAGLQDHISFLQQRLQQAKIQYSALCEYGHCQTQMLKGYYKSLFAANAEKVHRLITSSPLPNTANWSDERWFLWDASPVTEQRLIRVGDMVEQQRDGLSVPGYVPFIGGDKTIIIRCDTATSSQGLALLQSLIVRTACMLPHQYRYTLLDPSTNGLAFPMKRHLKSHARENSGDIRRDLDDVQRDINRIIETYLDAATMSFELVAPENRLNERFQFVFAAHFPDQYDRRAIEALQRVGRGGPVAGIYLFLHLNVDHEFPREMNREEYMKGFKNAFEIDLTKPMALTKRGLNLRTDSAPLPDMQKHLFEILDRSKPQELPLSWDSLIGIPEREWWQEDASQIVETPIGLRGSGDKLRMWFGVRNGQPCAHGVLAAMTGAGKSNLYHVLISGFAIRYSPKDL